MDFKWKYGEFQQSMEESIIYSSQPKNTGFPSKREALLIMRTSHCRPELFSNWIGMHSHTGNHWPITFSPSLCVHLYLLKLCQDIPSINNPPKHGILAIQLRLWRQCDEELASVAVGALVGHAHHATRMVL